MVPQEYYWHIELYSGEIINVKPDTEKVKYIQEMIAKQQGAITTPTRSIIVKDIKDFRLSDEMYSDQKVLEASARAFREPLYNTDGSIQARWVKKTVPRRRYDNHYRHIPAYKLLGETDSLVVVAFRLPVDLIDHTRVQECSDEDQIRMSRLVNSI